GPGGSSATRVYPQPLSHGRMSVTRTATLHTRLNRASHSAPSCPPGRVTGTSSPPPAARRPLVLRTLPSGASAAALTAPAPSAARPLAVSAASVASAQVSQPPAPSQHPSRYSSAPGPASRCAPSSTVAREPTPAAAAAHTGDTPATPPTAPAASVA